MLIQFVKANGQAIAINDRHIVQMKPGAPGKTVMVELLSSNANRDVEIQGTIESVLATIKRAQTLVNGK